MAIGDDNPPQRDLPELPALSGLGSVASGAQAQPAPAAGADDGPGVLHRDSDSPSDHSPAPQQPGSGSIPAGAVDPYLGKYFGGYELVEKIGQGGMGVVYKGRQVSLDRVVAVKILSKQLYDNQEFIKRFEREAKAVARINHPNIVAVYDFGQHEGQWYMVTEFIEGSSLSRLIAEKVMLDPKELAPLMVDCLAGLAHVEHGGVVHRDIKPDNILITTAGIAKIADFGLAKDVSGTRDNTDLTAVGLAMGTPAYMSPEQCMGRRLDGRSDIYALGVTAYYALAGEKPFVGHSSFEIMTKQREYMPPPPSQLNPRVPRDCSDLIMRMLAKNPQDRFDSAEACRRAWAELRERLQNQRASMRTGEFEAPQPMPAPPKSGRLGVGLPPPPAGAPPQPMAPPAMSPPPGPPLPAGELPSLSSPPPAGDTGRVRRSSGDLAAEPSATGTDSHGRPITERRLRQLEGAVTCPKCGMLNRSELSACSKCGNVLKEVAPDVAMRTQEAEAQRLTDAKRYGEAATIYARLADKEADRRLRSVLRSKEREIRKLEIEQQVADVTTRAKAMVERGDIKGAINALEQASSRISGDATASTSGAEMAVSRELAVLRARLRSSKRSRLVLVVLVLAAVAVGAFLLRERVMGLIGGGTAAAATETPAAPADGRGN